MAADGKRLAHTAEEARAERELADVWERLDTLIAQLRAHVPEQAQDLVHDLDAAAGDLYGATLEVTHARLCRILPQLADVLALACWPELVGLPDFLAPDGRPLPVTQPPPEELPRSIAHRRTAAGGGEDGAGVVPA